MRDAGIDTGKVMRQLFAAMQSHENVVVYSSPFRVYTTFFWRDLDTRAQGILCHARDHELTAVVEAVQTARELSSMGRRAA